MNRSAGICATPLLAATVVAFAAPPHYVPAPEIALDYRTAAPVEISAAELWVSTDSGRTWQPLAVAHDHGRTLRYSAPADGKYDFYVVLRNAAGSSGPAPEPGSTSMITVVVDTVPPLFQIHSAKVEDADDSRPTVVLNATLVEENLSQSAVRVFHRAASQGWTDGGPARLVGDDRIIWSPPTSVGPHADLRVIVTDLAGNSSTCEVQDVALPQPPESAPDRPPETQPVAEIEPPLRPVALPSAAPSGLQHLRDLADGFISAGHYSLAAARLEEALGRAPHDPDLLVGLGRVLCRVGRYDEASARFQTALAARPDQVGALEGLALVAATQKRYPQARQYMQRLQQLSPDSGSVWLRSGDIEYRLGNTAAALVAWARALKANDGDDNLREHAQRRLDYFGSGRTTSETSRPAGDQWQKLPPHFPSSSFTEKKGTRKPRP